MLADPAVSGGKPAATVDAAVQSAEQHGRFFPASWRHGLELAKGVGEACPYDVGALQRDHRAPPVLCRTTPPAIQTISAGAFRGYTWASRSAQQHRLGINP